MLISCGFTKTPVYRGGSHEKLIYRSELPKKRRGAWTVWRFKRGGGGGAWQKRVGGYFWGGMGGVTPPNRHFELGNNFNCDFNLLMPMSSLLIANKKSTILQLISY